MKLPPPEKHTGRRGQLGGRFVWGVAHGLRRDDETGIVTPGASASRRAVSKATGGAGFVAMKIIAEMDCMMRNGLRDG